MWPCDGQECSRRLRTTNEYSKSNNRHASGDSQSSSENPYAPRDSSFPNHHRHTPGPEKAHGGLKSHTSENSAPKSSRGYIKTKATPQHLVVISGNVPLSQALDNPKPPSIGREDGQECRRWATVTRARWSCRRLRRSDRRMRRPDRIESVEGLGFAECLKVRNRASRFLVEA